MKNKGKGSFVGAYLDSKMYAYFQLYRFYYGLTKSALIRIIFARWIGSTGKGHGALINLIVSKFKSDWELFKLQQSGNNSSFATLIKNFNASKKTDLELNGIPEEDVNIILEKLIEIIKK